MKVELKVREGGVVSPTRQPLLSALWQALSTMSLYCVKVSLKLRTDAALTPIYAANGKNVCVSSRESRLQSLSCPFLLNSRCLRIVIRHQGERVVMMLAEEEAEFEQDIN